MEHTSSLVALCAEVAIILSIDDVDPDALLGQLGIDSLNVVELILACQQVYPNVLNFESLSFDEHTTLREIDQRLIENSVAA